jgi:CRISPR-associated endonuclease Cas2
VAVISAVIAYDISGDDARAEIAALLSRHGIRLQQSVFQCEFADGPQLTDILTKVYTRADANTDVIHTFRQCVTCGEARSGWGQTRPALDVPYWIV